MEVAISVLLLMPQRNIYTSKTPEKILSNSDIDGYTGKYCDAP
jgi:hypothetical protein